MLFTKMNIKPNSISLWSNSISFLEVSFGSGSTGPMVIAAYQGPCLYVPGSHWAQGYYRLDSPTTHIYLDMFGGSPFAVA